MILMVFGEQHQVQSLMMQDLYKSEFQQYHNVCSVPKCYLNFLDNSSLNQFCWTFTVPFQAQNSPFPQIFSTIVCQHPPGLPSRTILDRTYSAQRFFIFNLFFSFYFGSCGRLNWINCQLSSARYYSIFTYLLTCKVILL